MDVLNSFLGLSYDQKFFGSYIETIDAGAMGDSEDALLKNGQSTNPEFETSHQHLAYEIPPQNLDTNPMTTVDGLIASRLDDWHAQTHASLDLNWTLELDGFALTPNNSFAESQPQPSRDVIMVDEPPPVPSLVEGHSSILHQIDSMGTRPRNYLTTPRLSVMSVSTLADEAVRSADLAKPPDVSEERPSASPNSQITKKPSKRKRISSFLSRKKQSLEQSETSPGDDVNILKIHQASAQTASHPQLTANVDGGSRARVLAQGHTSRIINTDWIAEWEQKFNTRRLDHPGICRDINIADCDRRPLSWPRRHLFRKSLDISIAKLTRAPEKKS